MATLQVKRVPDELYEQVKDRARGQGISVSEYVLRTLRHDLALTPLAEWVEARRADPIIPRTAFDSVQLLDQVREDSDPT